MSNFGQQYLRKIMRQSETKDEYPQIAVNLFGQRITSMMKDYDISMSKALQWDFEGFGYDALTAYREGTLEQDFMYYLWQNNVYGTKTGEVYTDVFMGRKEDLVLKKTEQ